MKKIFKVLRSIATSLLFLLLTAVVTLQFLFTSLKLESRDLFEMLDRDSLLEDILPEKIDDEEIEKVAKNFLNDYTNYIFHKRSYPSLQTVDFSNVTEDDLVTAKQLISTIEKRITLDYNDVLLLRDANSVLSNGSLYLLINVGVFFLFIIISLVQKSFKKGFEISAVSILASGFISAFGVKIAASSLKSSLSANTFNFVEHILTTPVQQNMIDLAFVYMAIAIAILLTIYLLKKCLFKKKA